MSFPRYELINNIQELKDKCPSRKHGRTWKQELNYRNDCVEMMRKCCETLKVHQCTLHRAIVLLQRFFSRCSSTEWAAMKKWALATACVFLATKIDSAYHRLDSVAHACFRALRALQQREPEPEYYNADGTPGNPAFVANLAAMVREAEMDLIFGLNFDFNAEVASSIVLYQLPELGMAGKPDAFRATAVRLACNSITAKGSVACLLYGSREIALACISKTCRAHGCPLDLGAVHGGMDFVPQISQERLAAIESALPKIVGESSAADSAATGGGGKGAVADSGNSRQQQDQGQAAAAAVAADGCSTPGSSFRGYAHGAAAAAGAAGVKQMQCAGGVVSHGSASEAATAGPRMAPSPISPDSETGPAPGAYGAAAGSSARLEQQQQQCRKRAREEGFSTGLRVTSEPPAGAAGGMLAA